MKILHLPTSVGGNSWGLSQGERKIGLDSRVLVTQDDYLGYPSDINLGWNKKNKFQKGLSAISAFWRYRHEFDVFHFNFGSTLIDFPSAGINLLDLPLYPKRKKKFFTYNGCDARQKFKTMARRDIAACHNPACYHGACNSGELDKNRARRIKIVSQYANHIFAVNPDLLYFLPLEKSSFLPYSISSWDAIEAREYVLEKVFNIVHSPTNRDAKGSEFIIHAVRNLQKKHPFVDFILVENLPNSQAMEIYQKAHLVIDQVLIGWYGAFTVEAMKMGKPVAVYINNEDLKFVPPSMAKDLKEAVINVNPATIEYILDSYIQNPFLLIGKSHAGRDYVNRWHDPVGIAKITKAFYEA